MKITYRELVRSLQKLEIGQECPLLVHASLSTIGDVQGGAETVLGALLAISPYVMMPAFTYRTMVIPEEGPPNNAIQYGSGVDINRVAEFYTQDLPADLELDEVAEALRQHPQAERSMHPILSFTGINSVDALQAQSIKEPLAPVRYFSNANGCVLLLGADHTVNVAIHYAEYLSGRPGFVRWALNQQKVVECPNFPGCALGFNAIEPYIKDSVRQVEVGATTVQMIPLQDLVRTVQELIIMDHHALLCDRHGCPFCDSVRHRTTKEPVKKEDLPTLPK